MPTKKYNLLLHRVLQYVAIMSVLAVLGGGYWYWKNARAGVEMDDNRPSFEAPLTHDLDLTQGQGAATYSRADGADRRATVTDFEGLIRPVKNGEARFEGAHRVENLLSTTSEDFSNAAWSNSSVSLASGIADPQGGTAAMRMTATGANGFISKNAGGTIGRTYTHSIWIRRVSGSGNIILHGNTIGETTVTSQVTTSWQRFSNTFTETDGNTYAGVRLGTSGDVVDVAFAQMEEVTGQANQNPSEYVSVGVKTAFPYHGAGADGVKYFDTENGNTVASNVVTEATGAAIATATLKGYLAEGTRTNAALRSEESDNASWGKTNATVSANAAVAPDGRTTADKIVEDTATSQHKSTQNISTTAGNAITFSVYAKKAERHFGTHLWNATDGTFGKAEVNLDTGAIISSTGTVYVESLPNGWYRIKITATPTVASSAYILMPHDGSSTIYAGDGSSGVYVWGVQLEQAPFASSYVPTTSASVTRASDSLRYPETGNFNDTTGTVSVEATPNWTGGNGWNAHWVSDSSSTVKLRIWHWLGAANHVGADRSANNGATRNQTDPSLTLTRGTMIKMATKWDGTALQQFNNGALAGTDSTLTLPYDALSNSLYIGSNNFVTDHAFSTIRNVRAWKKALTDTEMNNLTSLTQGISDTAVKKTTVKTPDNTGLVAYWSFEEGGGTEAEDFSPNGANTGTLTNMESADWVDGKFGKALAFDGVNEYVNVPDATSINPGTGNFTISAWIWVDSAPTDYRRLINKGAGSNYYAFVKFPDDRWRFEFRDGTLSTGDLDFGASTITYGNWTHLVATVDRGNNLTSGYLDGILKDTSSIAGYAAVSSTDYLSLGRSSIDAPYVIDDVRVYDRVLPQTEVADLYRMTASTKLNTSQNSQLTNGLVGLWSFNGPDVSGTTAYDRSGQGNDGTLTNGPTAAIGKVGQSLTFDGTNDYVSLPNVAALKPTGDFSVAFWYKGLKGSTENFIGHSPAVITNFWYINNTGATFCGGLNCNTSIAKTYTLPSDNEWHHLTVALDRTASPDTLTVYIDGASQGTTMGTGDGSGGTWGSTTWIGGPSWVNNGYRQGPVDEVRIYNRTLSSSEVRSLYDAGR